MPIADHTVAVRSAKTVDYLQGSGTGVDAVSSMCIIARPDESFSTVAVMCIVRSGTTCIDPHYLAHLRQLFTPITMSPELTVCYTYAEN